MEIDPADALALSNSSNSRVDLSRSMADLTSSGSRVKKASAARELANSVRFLGRFRLLFVWPAAIVDMVQGVTLFRDMHIPRLMLSIFVMYDLSLFRIAKRLQNILPGNI